MAFDGAFVYNASTDTLHVWDVNPTEFQTSHQQILERLGCDKNSCVGGSFKKDGSISFRSRTINNRNFGVTDLSNTKIAERIKRIRIVYNMNFEILNPYKLKYNS